MGKKKDSQARAREKPAKGKKKAKASNYIPGMGWNFYFGKSTAGQNITEYTAMQMTAVLCCVKILSEAVAQLPLHTYRYMPDGSKTKAMDHPLYQVLHDEPNEEMTSFIFRETMMAHLLLWGNAYAQIIRNGRGETVGLYPLLPDRMIVDRDEKGHLYYQYYTSNKDVPTMGDGTVILKPSDVLHIPGLGFDGLLGYSPIAMAKNAIGIASACEQFGASYFANGAAPGAILTHPNVLKNPQKIRDAWNTAFRGPANSNKVAVPVPADTEIPDQRDREDLPRAAAHDRGPGKVELFQHRADVAGIRDVHTGSVDHPVGAGHPQGAVHTGREEKNVREVFGRRPSEGRLRKPHERLRNRETERMDERERDPRTGRPGQDP